MSANAELGANAEAIEAWDGPLFDRFVRFRHIVVNGLKAHGDEALRLFPPQPGQRVLDIGCGFGDTTQDIARIVGGEAGHEGVGCTTGTLEPRPGPGPATPGSSRRCRGHERGDRLALQRRRRVAAGDRGTRSR